MASKLVALLAFCCRVGALLVLALTAANALLPSGARTWLLGANGAVARLVPAPLLGLFVMRTPFEGALRGDFVVVAIVLLVLDRVLCRVAASLR